MTQEQILPGQIVGGVGLTLHSSESWNVALVGQNQLTLAATPYEESLKIYKNGLLLRPGSGNDYTRSGMTVTFVTALAAGDVISDHYWTETASPGESVLVALPTADIIPGTFMSLNYDYDYNFTLPSGVLSTDLLLCAWNNWHNWGIDTGAGWIADYSVPNNQVCHKFVGSAVAGDVVSPSAAGQGYRGAGQMVIVRGADPAAPIYAITTGGTSISVGSAKRRVIHLVEQGTGGPDPTLSRGVEIQHAYDGTIGLRSSSEEVDAGGSVSCATNAGFLASVAIKAA